MSLEPNAVGEKEDIGLNHCRILFLLSHRPSRKHVWQMLCTIQSNNLFNGGLTGKHIYLYEPLAGNRKLRRGNYRVIGMVAALLLLDIHQSRF
jgi:hypothetical protein